MPGSNSELIPNAQVVYDTIDKSLRTIPGVGSYREPELLDCEDLLVLAIFVNESTISKCHQSISSINKDILSTKQQIGSIDHFKRAIMSYGGKVIINFQPNSLILLNALMQPIDLTPVSRVHPNVIIEILYDVEKTRKFSWKRIREKIDYLKQQSLLTPQIGQINWGHFKRMRPLCQNFGYQRGGPVDRYYLFRYISKIRSCFQGQILLIGGTKIDLIHYGLTNVDLNQVTVMDVNNTIGVDVVGDIQQPEIFKENIFDTIIAFNVLEHVLMPWDAINNMHRWLRPGGKVSIFTPTIQRMHACNEDYWRINRAAIISMMGKYSQKDVLVFGNIVASMAALYGLGMKELTHEELDFQDPDYPVAIGAIGEK